MLFTFVCLFVIPKYVHEFSSHKNYMQKFDKIRHVLRQNIKSLIALGNELLGKNGKQFQILWVKSNLKSTLG